MKEFPNILNVKNKNSFPSIHFNRVLCYLRRNIYEHIIKEDENNYFDLSLFFKQYGTNQNDSETMRDIIMKELSSLGWKTKLSFGDTGLFIYSTEEVPKSCW